MRIPPIPEAAATNPVRETHAELKPDEKIAAEGADSVVAVNQYLAPGDPGGLLNVAGVGVLSSSDNAAAAQALVDYLLSEAGQTYFAETTYEYPLRAGIALADGLPSLDELQPPALDLSDLDSIAETQELLDFCGQHGIISDVEVIKIQDIDAAYQRMLKSDVKYRFVIDMSSLKS